VIRNVILAIIGIAIGTAAFFALLVLGVIDR